MINIFLPYSLGRSTHCFNRLPDFFSNSSYYKTACINSFFPRTAQRWNILPVECFERTRSNSHLFLGYLLLYLLYTSLLLSYNSMICFGCPGFSGVNPNQKNLYGKIYTTLGNVDKLQIK